MSKFAKRHYEAIALAMQEAAPSSAPEQNYAWSAWWDCVHTLADTFAGDNAQFSRDRFARACLPGANVKARA